MFELAQEVKLLPAHPKYVHTLFIHLESLGIQRSILSPSQFLELTHIFFRLLVNIKKINSKTKSGNFLAPKYS